MRFLEWLARREGSEPMSQTTSFHPGQSTPGGFSVSPGNGAFVPRPGTGTMDKLKQWYDKHYQNYGGWQAVEKQAQSDPRFKAQLDKLKTAAAQHQPEVDPDGADDEDWATERWIDQQTQALTQQMASKGHGYWEKQAKQKADPGMTQSLPGQHPQAPPPNPSQGDDPNASVFGSRVQSLEDRLKSMEQMLSRLKPELFRPA